MRLMRGKSTGAYVSLFGCHNVERLIKKPSCVRVCMILSTITSLVSPSVFHAASTRRHEQVCSSIILCTNKFRNISSPILLLLSTVQSSLCAIHYNNGQPMVHSHFTFCIKLAVFIVPCVYLPSSYETDVFIFKNAAFLLYCFDCTFVACLLSFVVQRIK